jgi:hypothetical protein
VVEKNVPGRATKPGGNVVARENILVLGCKPGETAARSNKCPGKQARSGRKSCGGEKHPGFGGKIRRKLTAFS